VGRKKVWFSGLQQVVARWREGAVEGKPHRYVLGVAARRLQRQGNSKGMPSQIRTPSSVAAATGERWPCLDRSIADWTYHRPPSGCWGLHPGTLVHVACGHPPSAVAA
jgi:hypothetical protein